MKGKAVVRLLPVLIASMALCTCENIFKPYNDRHSPKYRIDKAKILIDEEEFDEAINELYPLWVADKENEELAFYYAIAHVGRSGLKILDLISYLGTNLDTQTILEAISGYFEDADDDDISDIKEAIRVIEFVSEVPTERSSRLNFLALFANWARIGIVLHRYAYDSNNALLSDSFDACKITSDIGGARTGLPHDAVDEIIISVPRILELASLVSGTGDAFDALLGSSFSGLSSASKLPIPCSSAPNNVVCLAARTLVNLGTDDSGIGLDTGNFAGDNPGPPVGECDNTYN